MHELGLTRNIVDIVAEHANGQRVTCVTVEIGRFAGVTIDSVRFCFDLVAEGTLLAGARLDIREIEGRARCGACGQEFMQDALFTRCPCGGQDFERLAGDELRIKSYELA